MSATDKKPRIVEEVPGVPANEAFFIEGVDHLAEHAPCQRYGMPHFPTKADAEMFLAQFGIMDFDVEWFRP